MSTFPLPLALGPTDSRKEYDLMVSGSPYLAVDPYLCRVRETMEDRLAEIVDERKMPGRMKKIRELEFFARLGKNSWIAAGFGCEYGKHITIGDSVYIGPNATFIDVCPIIIGDRTMFGANVQLYTPSHPLSPEERNGLQGPEWAKPITIGTDCWFGGGVIVLPGVTIGNGVTVGAGSVVTKDVEDRVVVVGNPARVIKRIGEDGEVVAVKK